MKLLILFVLLIAFSVLCSMIFTNPNKHSKCCEAPADQPIIGIFGVCLYLLGMAILVAAFPDCGLHHCFHPFAELSSGIYEQ